MIFVAIYDFNASNSEEVSINAGDFMTIVDASDPDWSLVTIKSNFEAPTGLVPKTYIEPAQPKYSVRALYDYSPQNEDEVDIVEGENFNVYLDDDQDWFWGTNARNKDGLAPRNYFSTDSSPCNNSGEDTDAHLQKNKLLNALDGFGFATTGPKKVPSEPKLELISYLVTDNDKKKKKKGFLGVGEDYMVSFVDEKSKKMLYQYHIKDVSFSEKKSKKFILNISQNGSEETKEYEGDKSDIQGLLAQFTQCQALYQKAIGSPKTESVEYAIPTVAAQLPENQTSKAELSKQQSTPKIVVAVYDYAAADNQELSIVENENLLVIDDNDPDWWMVRSMKKGGKEGFVPKTYVQYKQKLGDGGNNIQKLINQSSVISQHEAEKTELNHIREREEAEALAKEEAERMSTWKALEEQRIRWEKDRVEKEAEDEKRRQESEMEIQRQQEEEQNRLRKEQQLISPEMPKRSSMRGSILRSQPESAPPPIASRPDIVPPPIAARPDIAPPPIAARPDIAPPPIASRPDIAPPPIASRPDIAPPPIASRPDIPAPPIASRPDIAPPPIASRPDIPAPPIASRPDVAPPRLSSRPEIPPPSIESRPSIGLSRPDMKMDTPPPIASRPNFAPPIFSRPEITPAIPSRPSTEALGTASKNETHSSRMIYYTNVTEYESVIREWMDKTGTFKVKAVLVSVIDNKVHLRKCDTGGKITIQLDKLHPNDIDYIRSIPGYEHVAATGPLAQKFPPPQNRKIEQVDSNILQQAASIKLSEPSPSTFMYNGFDWKSWLIQAGVSQGDAITYGQKFSSEKLDSSSISSLDRDLLRALGVSEGDIIRIKRAVVDSISVDETNSASRELEAQNRNLEKIRKVSSARSSFVGSDVKLQDPNNQKQEQIESDAALARRLQFEEIQPQAKPKAQKSFSSNAVDLNAIKDATAILEASNNSTKNAPSVLRKASTVNKNVTAFSTLPSTEEAISSSLGIKENESYSKHSPWSIPGQDSKVPQIAPPFQTAQFQGMSSAQNSIKTNLPPPVIPVRPTPPNLIVTPQEALTKTQMQQKEAQMALQRAQYDLKMAQEQAKQAALIQEQTKRAQAQEAESALALAKAQEAARQAAIMKEQSERALRAAQAGMIQSAPPQNPVPGTFGSSIIQPNMASMNMPANNFVGMMPNQPVVSNGPYQTPGSTSGMIMGPGGAFIPMAPNMIPSGGFPRPGLQAPLIPVANPVTYPARSVARPTPKSSAPAPNSNDPYAVFRSADVNEPSIFTNQGLGIQNQPAQPYGQSNMAYAQNPTFLPHSNAPNFSQGQFMNPQGQMQSQYGIVSSQSALPAQFPNMLPNQVPGNSINKGPQYINNQMPNQSQIPPANYQNSAGPNFMPPYNPGGNQSYNR